MDAMNLENAISTILKRLELTNKQRDLLMGETCQMIRNNRELILEDRSFYQVGMEYYEFEDNDSHHDNTNLKFVKVYDTLKNHVIPCRKKQLCLGYRQLLKLIQLLEIMI